MNKSKIGTVAGVLFMALVGCLVAIGIRSSRELAATRELAACVHNGGELARVNCHAIEHDLCITADYGDGMPITTCAPTTSKICDTVCRVDQADGSVLRTSR